MAAKPKLTPEQWASTRATWETDPREGYAWLVEEMGLDVSAPGVRKTAMRDGWAKCKPAVAPPGRGKVSPASKVSQRNHPKVSQARRETIKETMPETFEGAGAGGDSPAGAGDALSNGEHESYLPLAPREERFVGEYLIDLNGKQAAIRAGYSPKTAASIASQLLIKLNVQAAIAAAQAERAKRTTISADRALSEAWALVVADARELVQVKLDSHGRQRLMLEECKTLRFTGD